LICDPKCLAPAKPNQKQQEGQGNLYERNQALLNPDMNFFERRAPLKKIHTANQRPQKPLTMSNAQVRTNGCSPQRGEPFLEIS
jgi:hypothetical protein